MFERFTPGARAVVVGAQEHSRRLHHGYVGCEHLLLALVNASSPVSGVFTGFGVSGDRVETAVAELLGPGAPATDDRAALAALGIDLDEVRKAVEANFGPGALDRPLRGSRRRWRRSLARRRRRRDDCAPRFRGHVPFTAKAKKCLELALREAIRLKHRHIGVEHLALGLLRDDTTMAARVLRHLGVDIPTLRRAVVNSLRRSA